jgi:hypothetical protein
VRHLKPVIFATLTDANTERHRDYSAIGDLLVGTDKTNGVSGFVKDLCFHTKTHIYPLVGWDTSKNIHAHLGLFVPDDELERFHSRLPSFSAWIKWNCRILDFQEWDDTKGDGVSYIGGKHIPWLTGVRCPRIYSRCRQGKCDLIDEIPSRVERFAG